MPSVFPDWMANLSMQQQSVLVLAARGPDGIRKYHPCKEVVKAYRACVLKAAYFGREMRLGEGAGNFMTLDKIASIGQWSLAIREYFDHVDELPHHYHLHLMHGAQILSYKHPSMLRRQAWGLFYVHACNDLHLAPETEKEMDARLGDWGRKHWASTEEVA